MRKKMFNKKSIFSNYRKLFGTGSSNSGWSNAAIEIEMALAFLHLHLETTEKNWSQKFFFYEAALNSQSDKQHLKQKSTNKSIKRVDTQIRIFGQSLIQIVLLFCLIEFNIVISLPRKANLLVFPMSCDWFGVNRLIQQHFLPFVW